MTVLEAKNLMFNVLVMDVLTCDGRSCSLYPEWLVSLPSVSSRRKLTLNYLFPLTPQKYNTTEATYIIISGVLRVIIPSEVSIGSR